MGKRKSFQKGIKKKSGKQALDVTTYIQEDVKSSLPAYQKVSVEPMSAPTIFSPVRMDVELVSDKCNEAKRIIEEALKENADLQGEFQGWDRLMSDRRVAFKLMERVERLLARFEAVLGKLEVIQDQALTLKKTEGKKGVGSA